MTADCSKVSGYTDMRSAEGGSVVNGMVAGGSTAGDFTYMRSTKGGSAVSDSVAVGSIAGGSIADGSSEVALTLETVNYIM